MAHALMLDHVHLIHMRRVGRTGFLVMFAVRMCGRLLLSWSGRGKETCKDHRDYKDFGHTIWVLFHNENLTRVQSMGWENG